MGGRTAKQGLTGPERALQIAMAAIGAILLVGALVVIVRGAIGPNNPAVVEVVERQRDVQSGRTIVEVEAINRGDATAASVVVVGQASGDQAATATLDYVPGHSRRAATLTFAGDLGSAPVSLQVEGWIDP
jgi:uncharacterized protein (TIGR02588 family)